MMRMERRRIEMAERKQEKKARAKARAGLRRKQSIEELSGTRGITAGDAKSEYATYSEEIDARQEAAKEVLQRRGLPGLLIRTYQRLHTLQEISELSHRQICANSH